MGLEETISRIAPLDRAAEAIARSRQGRLTKPPGSLGQLEDLAVALVAMRGSDAPLDRVAAFVFAADHGVADEGVSAYPQAVTAQMVANMANGGAAVSVLARDLGARLVLTDVGVRTAPPRHPLLRERVVRRGTASLLREPAMTRADALASLEVGIQTVEEHRDGLDLAVTGEMGIANTTAASALAAVFTGRAPGEVTGRGTGIDDGAHRHKIRVIEQALALHRPDPSQPVEALSAVGGLEIGALAGVIVAAAARRVPVVLDGFIASAAALVARALAPGAIDYCIAGHRSVEPGHRVVLDTLGLRPVLDLSLRLGEGSGALLAVPVLRAAIAVHRGMATFDEAGVSDRPD